MSNLIDEGYAQSDTSNEHWMHIRVWSLHTNGIIVADCSSYILDCETSFTMIMKMTAVQWICLVFSYENNVGAWPYSPEYFNKKTICLFIVPIFFSCFESIYLLLCFVSKFSFVFYFHWKSNEGQYNSENIITEYILWERDSSNTLTYTQL